MKKKKLRVIHCQIIRKEGDILSCYLKTLEEETQNKREQRIVIDQNRKISDWNCTCSFGSVWRFSKKWLGTNKKCRHIERCIEHLEELGYFYI